MEKNTEKEMQIEWESLGISNDFLFGKVMQNPELCKKLLQRIFPDMPIDHIEYPELQKTIRTDMDAKGVRLDVYVKDGKETVYDIEMQVINTKELPKRSRYYQSVIDLQLIDRGRTYEELSKSYVIFICPVDVFKRGRHIYTFENICREDNSVSLGDETTKIFLNAKGTMDDVNDELKAFLDYVAGKKTEDSFVDELEEAVKKARKNKEWRLEYMTMLMEKRLSKAEGLEEGVKGMISVLRKMGVSDDEIVQKIVEEFRYSQEKAEKLVYQE